MKVQNWNSVFQRKMSRFMWITKILSRNSFLQRQTLGSFKSYLSATYAVGALRRFASKTTARGQGPLPDR
jgi:hypothetical protein